MDTQQTKEALAAMVRNAVFAARDRGDTVYAASEDAAAAIMRALPSLDTSPTGEGSVPRARLEGLLEKWRLDRACYPLETFGAQWASTAVKLCEDELRATLEGVR